MSIGFFLVGGVIFAAYMGLTIWNIIYSNRKQREENYSNYYKFKAKLTEEDYTEKGLKVDRTKEVNVK